MLTRALERFRQCVLRYRIKRMQRLLYRPPISSEFIAHMGDTTTYICVAPDDINPLIIHLLEMYQQKYPPPENLASRCGVTYLAEHRFKQHPAKGMADILHITFYIEVEDIITPK